MRLFLKTLLYVSLIITGISWVGATALAGEEECDFVLHPKFKKKKVKKKIKNPYYLNINNTLFFSGPSDFINRYQELIAAMSNNPGLQGQYPELIKSKYENLNYKLNFAQSDQSALVSGLTTSGLAGDGGKLNQPLGQSPRQVLAPLRNAVPDKRIEDFARDAIVICLAPGDYPNPIAIQNKSNLRIIGLNQGGKGVRVRRFKKVKGEPGKYIASAIAVHASSNIILENMVIENPRTVYPKPNHPISRAVQVLGSVNVFIRNSHLISKGKGTLWAHNSLNVNIQDSRANCYYFCVVGGTSEINAINTQFMAKHRIAEDGHSMLWTNHSDQYYSNCTFNMKTGRAMITGVNTASTDYQNDIPNKIIFTGRTRANADRVKAWLQQNPGYDGIEIDLYGIYPKLKASVVNDYKSEERIAKPQGHKVRIHKADATPEDPNTSASVVETKEVPYSASN